MATDKTPAFQFYPRDFLANDDVSLMTNEQIGAYVLLLCNAWQMPEGLPAALSSLARLARCTPNRFVRCVWPGVVPCFYQGDSGRWFNGRIESERQKQADFREAASRAGKRSAVQRALNGRSTNLPTEVQRPPQRNVNGSSTLLSATAVPTPKNGVGARLVVARYVDRYRERCGGKSPVISGKESGALAQLAKRLGPEDAAAWVDKCFAAADPFWVSRGYPPSSIPELINGLQAKAGTTWNASRPSDDEPCQRCGHPEKRFHSLTECNDRVLSQNRPVSAETA